MKLITFNNISVTSWRQFYWLRLHRVHLAMSGILTHNVSDHKDVFMLDSNRQHCLIFMFK